MTNSLWWREKIGVNASRDQDTDRVLHNAGWLAIRVWEHELAPEADKRIEEAVRCRKLVRS